MSNYRIAFIPGDGVGREVSLEAAKVLNAAAAKCGFNVKIEEFDWGCDHYLERGVMMDKDGLKILREFDAIFLGSVGDAQKVPDHISLTLVLDIRKGFDQYINLRPIKLYPGVEPVIKTATPKTVDMVVVRENTEGEYSMTGGFFKPEEPGGFAVQNAIFSRKGCERVIDYAFELGRRRRETENKPGKVTNCTKSNALNYSMVFWDSIYQQIAKLYPDIETDSALVDALAMWMIRNPEKYDVIVASNLFGDIITDLGAMLQGGMGMAAGANINPKKQYPSMFEPIHGSAPDIMFKGIVNPIASVESIKMMLEHLEEKEAAAEVEKAVVHILENTDIRTVDIGGRHKTAEVGDALEKAILG